MDINLVEGQGYQFTLKTTNERHFGAPQMVDRGSRGDIISEFGYMFSNAIDSVNQKQVYSDNLVIEAGVNPDQVDIAQVMNSIAEAEMSLSFTKAIVDRAVRAYQEVTTMR